MTSDKKVIEIHGVLQKPLEIGSSAFILEDNGIRRTSTVLEYKQVSENEIHFETLNTIYHLRLKQNKSLCGVILKHMIQTAEKSNLQNEGRKFVLVTKLKSTGSYTAAVMVRHVPFAVMLKTVLWSTPVMHTLMEWKSIIIRISKWLFNILMKTSEEYLILSVCGCSKEEHSKTEMKSKAFLRTVRFA